MNSQEWFILLNSRINQLKNAELKTTFVDLVEHLANNGDLICNNGLHPDAIASMILVGSIATGELEEVSKLLANLLVKCPDLGAVEIHTRGFNKNREQFLQGLFNTKSLKILRVVDKTGIPHNGCRRPAKRRI